MLPFFKLLQRELRARIGEAEKRSAMSIKCVYLRKQFWPSELHMAQPYNGNNSYSKAFCEDKGTQYAKHLINDSNS